MKSIYCVQDVFLFQVNDKIVVLSKPAKPLRTTTPDPKKATGHASKARGPPRAPQRDLPGPSASSMYIHVYQTVRLTLSWECNITSRHKEFRAIEYWVLKVSYYIQWCTWNIMLHVSFTVCSYCKCTTWCIQIALHCCKNFGLFWNLHCLFFSH